MSVDLASCGKPEEGWRDWFARRIANLRERLAKGLVSDSIQVGLRRAAPGPDDPPPTKLPLFVRAMTPQDVAEHFPADPHGMSRADEADIAMRREMAALAPECGIAVIDERTNRVCFLQWVIGPGRNDAIGKMEGLPQLAEGQMMLEGAYVPPADRGRTASLAAAGVALAHAGKLGAREVITFVGEANTVAMRGIVRLGFRPYMLHVRRHLLFGLIEYDRFRPVSPDDTRFAGKF